MHPKTMRCVFFVSNLCTFTVMWLFLRYSSSRSPAFLKRDALERVYAQFETGGKKGVEDPALALDAANHSRQPESMDFFLGTSRDAHDQVESGVSERRNESAFKARVFGSETSGERVANKKLVNIMLWKRDHMDRFWGAGQTNRVLSRGNMCSPSCRYSSSDDVHKFKDKPLDAVLIYAGHLYLQIEVVACGSNG